MKRHGLLPVLMHDDSLRRTADAISRKGQNVLPSACAIDRYRHAMG